MTRVEPITEPTAAGDAAGADPGAGGGLWEGDFFVGPRRLWEELAAAGVAWGTCATW